VLIGNLLGALFVAYFLADQTGIATAELPLERLESIALAKGVEETECCGPRVSRPALPLPLPSSRAR
jgi:hypothetical protein